MALPLMITLWGMAFALTLVVVIGVRLAEQAGLVIAAVLAGVAASIPASLLMVRWAVRALTAPPASVPPPTPSAPAPTPQPPPASPKIIGGATDEV